MFKSATFAIGIILALGAFVGFLVLGNFLAPPPASVVVALRDISSYTPLDATMLGVDAQHLNGQVLATLVQKEELDQYIGGFVTTPIFAGEPLRKSAIVNAGNPLASKRLALALTDPNRVAAVIPVNAQTSPTQIVTGDYVDLVISMAPGNLTGGNSDKFGQILAGQDNNLANSVGFGPSAVITPTRGTTLPSLISATGVISGFLPGDEMNLPVTKAVIRSVPVLAVSFEQTPNPTYASAGFGENGNAAPPPQPAYLDGEIKSITVSVPRDSAELLNFGIDNGKVHVMLLPVQEGQTEFVAQKNDPTLGVSWNDVLAFMIKERQELAAAFNLTAANNGASNATNTSATNPNNSGTPAPAMNPTAVPTTVKTPTPRPTATQVASLGVPTAIAGIANGINNAINGGSNNSPAPQNQLPTGPDVMAIITPLACGFLFLVLAIIVIRVIRRRRMTHVTP
ncbi:MAG TPA: SAF domain-containing protein [Anaerolineae bacterium]|nr:SAF domain-containing protein [Anaerolineae bacterium]